MSVIRRLVANTGVQAVVIVVVKTVGDTGLGIGQVGKNGPLAPFEHLGFEAGPEAAKTLNRFSAWALSSHSPRRLCERPARC